MTTRHVEGEGVGSRFRGNDVAPGSMGRRGAAPSMALGRRMDSCLRRNGGGALRPDRSALSRRVRGVLSPSRERGNTALARLKRAGFPPVQE